MIKRLFACIFIVTLSIGIVSPGVDFVSAQSIAELEENLQALENERKTMDSDENETKEKIAENERRQKEVAEKIKSLDADLAVTAANLEKKQAEINETTAKINALQTSITETEEQIEKTEEELEILANEIESLIQRIADRDHLIRNRLRSIQHSGGKVNYLQVLFGAQNFSDFINRVSAVTRIVDSDRTIMELQEQDKQALEVKQAAEEEKKQQLVEEKNKLDDQKAELEKSRNALVAQRQELTTLQAQLNEQRTSQVSVASELEAEHEHLEEHTMSIEEERQVLEDQERVIKQLVEQRHEEARLEKERIEKERIEKERQRIEAERKEAERLEQLAKEKAIIPDEPTPAPTPTQSSPAPSSPNPSNGGGGDGSFIWPAQGRLSSSFGWRSFNGGSFHNGVDIANSRGTPIIAAASGIITRSAYSSSYGNVVYIYHPDMNKTTVYAHLDSRSVSLFQSVSQGQRIGTMGNTGRSFGDHLHFEVHNGQWSQGSGVNPMPFLP